MTRILFMHQASSIGGGSYCLLNILKAIDRDRFEPVVALLNEGPLADELRKIDVEVVIFCQMAAIPYNRSLLQRDSLKAYWNIRKSIPALKKLLKENSIDVLYLNNMMLCRYLQPAKECGCKTVVHVREHWPLNEHKRQLEWARKCVYGYADKMIAINHYSASMFPKKDASIVYDWIDLRNRYKAIPFNELFGEDMTNKKVLLFTGGFQSIKGADYVVDAFVNFVKGEEYRLLVLGANSDVQLSGLKHRIKIFLSRFGYYYYQQELIRKVQSDPRILCVAGVYEIVHIIEQSCCFVSYFRIPHANLALAENIILGNPCIVVDNEESREYSNNGAYAMLVAPNNPALFSQQLNCFLEGIEKWENAAKSGMLSIAEKFDVKKNSAALCEVLNSL